jgi:predicted  nucleic acid-binding Zn-ribbon protein
MLIHRIKELELERNRTRTRQEVLSQKIHDQDQTLQSLTNERNELLKYQEKFEKLRNDFQRKENQCQDYRQKISRLDEEINELKQRELGSQVDSQKKIK